MREIKFRAWDKEELEMISAENLLTHHNNRYLNESLASDEKVTLMQFTGLTDKNGLEVFEGDIIQYGTPTTQQSSIFWSPQDFGFVTYNELLGEHTGLSFFSGYKNFEIIGNIHSNPELLEQKQ